MRFCDIGANLSHSAFSQDLAQTIERARQALVERIVVTGTTVDESMAAARIAEEFDLHATAGVEDVAELDHHCGVFLDYDAPKPFHIFSGATQGPVAVASIGSPSDLLLEAKQLNIEVTVVQYLNILFSRREPDAHKGDFGHILVVGGSVGKAGAAAMAGMAALRSGAGLVTVACPRSVQPTIASFAPEIMTEALPETSAGTLAGEALEPIEKLLHGKDVVVLGPGLYRNAETDELVRQLLTKIAPETKIVLDADGLNAFAGHPEALHAQRLLMLTPHPGEMSRLTGLPVSESHTDRIRIARQVAKDHGAIVVLKGHRTVTASPSGQVWVNMTGNPGMAKGGSGDVLSGIIAACHTQRQGGFMIRSSLESHHRMMDLMRRRDEGDEEAGRELEEISRKNIFDMFCLFTSAAVCLHGLAGDMARDLYGQASMVATDIVGCIGEAISFSQKTTSDKLVYLQR